MFLPETTTAHFLTSSKTQKGLRAFLNKEILNRFSLFYVDLLFHRSWDILTKRVALRVYYQKELCKLMVPNFLKLQVRRVYKQPTCRESEGPSFPHCLIGLHWHYKSDGSARSDSNLVHLSFETQRHRLCMDN